MKNTHIRLIAAAMAIFLLAAAALAQTEIDSLKAQGRDLVEAQRFPDALPIYEKLATLAPKDPEVLRNLGFSLLGKAATVTDPESRRQLRIRARQAMIGARDNGEDTLLVKGLIEGLPPDGRDSGTFSDNAEANKLMVKAEASFAQGKMDDAFASYQAALAIDPRCYEAALFSGDTKMQTQKFDEAEKWYQRAITINPFRETAYRYSATPLMKQQRYDEARDRYIEAYITEPYSKLATSGIVGWAQIRNAKLGHPRIDAPQTDIDPDGKAKTTIDISPNLDDGSLAWASYVATREAWRKEKFAQRYPREHTYRHSLAEEADALRSVVTAAKALKPKSLNPQIAMIEQMDNDGVLEAFVLLARPDEGIAADQRDYLANNRDKLRKYVLKYVIHTS